MDFDTTRLYYSHQQLQQQQPGTSLVDDGEDNHADIEDPGGGHQDDVEEVNLPSCRRHFREFLRNYRLGPRFVYRERLLRMHCRRTRAGTTSTGSSRVRAVGSGNTSSIQVDLSHLGEYDAALMGYLLNQPATVIPTLELAAHDALTTLLYENNNQEDHGMDQNPDNDGNQAPQDDASSMIHILWVGTLRPTSLRQIQSEHMGRLLSCPGIVISTSPVRNRAVRLMVRCHRCNDERVLSAHDDSMSGTGGGGGFGTLLFPATCHSGGNGNNNAAMDNGGDGAPAPAGNECGRYPYAAVPDESQFVDQQTLKLQEAPETVPTGELPRSVLLTVERSLVDVAPPGTRISVLAIPTLFASSGGSGSKSNDAAKSVYLRVVGLVKENHGSSTNNGGPLSPSMTSFSPAEEEAFRALSQHPNIYGILTRSMAPNISGSYTVDIKRALVCQLMGGVSKRLPDGVRLRGDINVLLLGDPSMAKSQFLKFVSKVAPVGIYTSGKGSSAAGLTASVVRDAKGEFYLEGGALVLADGGVVCIDEFDKMRANDRVAIHEAMEQQTISVAKAGITTVLHSRASVLAAANPVFGRYDELKSAHENIDLMTTILSRFDVIFLVRDVRDEERDRSICQHVMGVHMDAAATTSTSLGTSTNPHSSSSTHALLGTNHDGPNHGLLQNGRQNDFNPFNSSTANTTPEAIAGNAMQVATTGEGELDIPTLKKYIQYCKVRCNPSLTEESGKVLESHYVQIRNDVRQRSSMPSSSSGNGSNGRGGDTSAQAAIPITVRQLEALVRLSESLARMRLDDKVRREDVVEALRLFSVSTLAANATDNNSNNPPSSWMAALGGAGAPQNREELDRTESFLRSRLVLGNTVNKQRLMEEATAQGFHAVLVARALSVLSHRGDVLERHQGRLLKRVK